MISKSIFRTLAAMALLTMAVIPVTGVTDDALLSPVAIVEKTAASLAERLTGRQEYYAEHPDELYALIDEVLLPKFDVQYAGKLVLGKTHWLAATEEQRMRFITAFYSFLVKSYAKGILELDQEKMVVIPEASFAKDGLKAMVRTELIIDGGDNIQVNYSVRQTENTWKIYDVRIEGVSYIQNYRNQFDAEITAQGIEAVINRLEQAAAEADRKAGEAANETTAEEIQAI